MLLPEEIQARVSELGERFEKCIDTLIELREEARDSEFEHVRTNDFVDIFRDICAFIEESEPANPPYLLELFRAVSGLFDDGTEIACGPQRLYPMMPSWAHSDEPGRPLVEDRSIPLLPLPSSSLPQFLRLFGVQGEAAKQKMKEILPPPWNASTQRHSKSTRLARFRLDLPTLSATPSTPRAMRIYDARCEISSNYITPTISLCLTENNSCMFLLGTTGYKNRDPGLEYYFLDQVVEIRNVLEYSKKVIESIVLANRIDDYPLGRPFQPGLTGIATSLAVDETRGLVFVGDGDRVKSYLWGNPDGTYYDKLTAVHTFDSRHHPGPIAVLPNGSVIRAGKGEVAVWSNEVETHGDEQRLIGEQISIKDSWRDDPEKIEWSSGSPHTSSITFSDQPYLKPSIWKQSIESPSTLIITAQDTACGPDYSCVAIDLEADGKTRGQYFGHSGVIKDIAVSVGDPRMFVTGCMDGYARLYDSRRSLPVLTLDACGQEASCEAVVIAHPDGIPTIFTGSGKQECIKVWDVRAHAAVYELSTGNNAVVSLAWNTRHDRLYAATRCRYVDEFGHHHNYRRARVPKPVGQGPGEVVKTGQEENDDDSYVEDDERYWPDRARHPENYFGHLLDAGEHRLYQYAFKEDPNPAEVPVYGDGTLDAGEMR